MLAVTIDGHHLTIEKVVVVVRSDTNTGCGPGNGNGNNTVSLHLTDDAKNAVYHTSHDIDCIVTEHKKTIV